MRSLQILHRVKRAPGGVRRILPRPQLDTDEEVHQKLDSKPCCLIRSDLAKCPRLLRSRS